MEAPPILQLVQKSDPGAATVHVDGAQGAVKPVKPPCSKCRRNHVKSVPCFGMRKVFSADEPRDDHGRWATIAGASSHMAKGAKAFSDNGGKVETLTGREDGDKLRFAERELSGLRQGLVEANGGKDLPARVEKGFQLAMVALSMGRAKDAATIRIARTADGHIAAVMASYPRPVLNPETLHLALIGSTGITGGAGSALVSGLMSEARDKGLGVSVEPLDDEVGEKYWKDQLGAGESRRSGEMAWTVDETKRLASAA